MNGDGSGKRAIMETAAKSVFMTGLARILIIGMTGIGFPAVIAMISLIYTDFSEQRKLNAQQSAALQQLSGNLSLMEYRLGKAEEVNRDQERHFRATDGRVNHLERVVPPPARRGWPYYDGEEEDQR